MLRYFTSTYDEFLQYNKVLKNLNKLALTIVNVDFVQNRIDVKYKDNLEKKIVNSTYEIEFVISRVFNADYYITNPSLLSNWKGFNTDNLVYLDRLLMYVLDRKIFDEYDFFDYSHNKGLYTLRFLTIQNIDSYILRQKLAYNVEGGKLGEHFWYVLDQIKYEILLISDKSIYTPINSDSLFSNLHFNVIDFSNVYLTKTKSFNNTFYCSFCSNIIFGNNLPIAVKSLNYMFSHTCHLETVDLLDWDLSKVEDIRGICDSSKVKNFYISETIIPKNIKYVYALSNTYIKNTNIYDIFNNFQIEHMKKMLR